MDRSHYDLYSMTFAKTTNLKFCLLNAENLFLMFDVPLESVDPDLKEFQWQKLSSSKFENKPLKKCLDLQKCLFEIDADIVMLCEVGGIESLKNFNKHFMNDLYEPYLIEGNSDRNIDVGFLIRKTLTLKVELSSNKDRLINYLYPHEVQSLQNGYAVKGNTELTSHRFSRDVAELKVFFNNSSKADLIILLTHLKSRLDPERIDPNGFERRQAELKTLLDIYKEIKTANPQLPIIVAGDFNGNASSTNTDEEFKELYNNSDLKDVLEYANIAPEDRATFYQVRNSSRADGKQIDFVFLSPETALYLNKDTASVFRYRDERGFAAPIPRNMDLKAKLPSDHYPIVFELWGLPLA